MAVMQLNSNMVQWKIYISADYKSPARDLTSVIGPHTNSIRIRHGMSEGGLTKRNIHSSSYEIVSNHRTREKTAPTELDLQISCHSYLEDLFQEGVCVKIDMKNKYCAWVTVFKGIIGIILMVVRRTW
jgi:hypothetical protein